MTFIILKIINKKSFALLSQNVAQMLHGL